MNLPITAERLDDDTNDYICRTCGSEISMKGPIISMNFGAFLFSDELKESGHASDKMELFWHFMYYGRIIPPRDYTYTYLTLVSKMLGGQADLRFCSIECLRTFFSSAIDLFEAKIAAIKIADDTGAESAE
ncbi:MAG TPA: hypothetical protein VFE47_14775 [Tepidisphaeraceae bacterium]|nr:hypothetical protein [Tepidisphaeraceae bacterium]